MANTKARHLEILSVATKIVSETGGAARIDALDKEERKETLRQLALRVQKQTGCTDFPARSNVAKALRQDRYVLMKKSDDWGGARTPSPEKTLGPNSMPLDQKRQPVSTRLAPGYLDLAKGIAVVEGLAGWGRAVEAALDLMVENDPGLKTKLAEIEIIPISKRSF